MNSKYIESKIDNKLYCKTNGQFARHLRMFNLTNKDYHEIYITGYTPLCHCLKPVTFYREGKYASSCGLPMCVGKTVSNTKQTLSTEKKLIASENYKRAHKAKTSDQLQAERDKKKKTYFEKYRESWANSSVQKDKTAATKLEKYGDSTYNNSLLTAEKNKNKSVDEKNQINDRRRTTNLERYGVETCLLMPYAKIKSAISNSKGREFILPSGKIIRVRGYEDAAITKLLETYHEHELVVDNLLQEYDLPVFKYVNVNQHTALYYPDIYIPKENKIIEVKSRWWWDGNGDEKYISRLSNNIKKRQSVVKDGYKYELWLFDDKRNYKILTNDTDFQV